MSVEQVREELLEANLHEESVERILDHFQRMQQRLREGEYDEAGTHIGNFCENIVNLLRDQMGEGVQPRPQVGTFIDDSIADNIGSSEPDCIRIQVPRVLRAAYDIRNFRDSVHVNLRISVNHADTQAGVAMCSWILAEVLRVYGASEETEEMEEVGELIDELSQPVSDGNPLEGLITSHEEFDRQRVFRVLDGLISIHNGDVLPGKEFSGLDTRNKVITLLLGRRAAADLEEVDTVSVSPQWLSDHADVTPTRIRQIMKDLAFVDENSEGHHIPGFRIEEATEYINSE